MRKLHNSKHKYNHEYVSDDERSRYLSRSKSKNHHHKRKYKKNRHENEEAALVHFKTGNEQYLLRNQGEDIEKIQRFSSDDEYQNGSNVCDYHDRQADKYLLSQKYKHHKKDDKKERKRRKLSGSDSQNNRDSDIEYVKSRHKRSKREERYIRNASDSESEYFSLDGHKRRKMKEMDTYENREIDQSQKRVEENKGKDNIQEKFPVTPKQEKEMTKVQKESQGKLLSRQYKIHDEDKRIHQEPSSSNNKVSGGKRSSKEEDKHSWGTTMSRSKTNIPQGEVQKPSFELSGKLVQDTNIYNGVVIKYSEPPEARIPKKRWRLYPFKGDQPLPPLYIHRQSAYLIGRDRKVADMPIDHPSCSKQHAALQYRLISYQRPNGTAGKQIRLYIIDLESANGTFVNNKKIESKKYFELFEKDVIKFGFSSREYVLLHEHSRDEDKNLDDT